MSAPVPDGMTTVLAIAGGVGHGAQVPAAVIVVAGCVLGAAAPDGAWRRALVLGLAMPIAHLVALVVGSPPPYPVRHFALTLLALVPAFVGSYLGVAIRRSVEARRDRHSAP